MKRLSRFSGKSYFIGVFSGIAVSLALLGAGLYSMTDSPSEMYYFFKNFALIKQRYYKDVPDKVLLRGAEDGMLKALGDPYSSFMEGDVYQNFKNATSGGYTGIGIVIGLSENREPMILEVFRGSAAEKNGLKREDIIRTVDGIDVQAIQFNDIASRIRGAEGTVLKLTVNRGGEEISLDITRESIELPTVSEKMLDGNVGYIHIYSFAQHTDREFSEALESLKEQGMEKLILDVRMNPGGLLDSAVNICDKILPQGPVVSFHTKNGTQKTYSVNGTASPIPMAVLIDKNSASASEILAAAVQDRNAGFIIGETSFGKGTVQEVYPEGEDSALRISIAEYKTPAGRTLDKIGVHPDIPVQQDGQIFDEKTDSVILAAMDALLTQEEQAD